MKTVKQHPSSRDDRDAIAMHEETVAILCAQLENSRDPVSVLLGLTSTAKLVVNLASSLDHRERALDRLRIVSDAVVALFRLAAHPGIATQFSIDDHTYSILVPGQHRSAGPTEWLLGFSAASACRHGSAFRELANVPPAVLEHSQLSMRWSTYVFPLVHAFQALARRDANAGALLLAARDEASRFDGDVARRDLVVAEIDLAQRLHEANAIAFNEALERALLAHRVFWTNPASADDLIQDRANYPDGFLALRPLALACIAHDRGIPVDVESDYIPRWIVSP